jgi:hypothetical protein
VCEILGALRPGLSRSHVIESLYYTKESDSISRESDSVIRESDSKDRRKDSMRTKVLYKQKDFLSR